MSDIAVTVTSPGSVNATIGAGGGVSATVSSGGSVAVNLPAGEAAWANITGKPTEFTPTAHQHVAADITDRSTALVTSVNGQTGAVTVSGGGGGGASLSDDPAQPLSLFPSAGVSTDAARADHVHQFPSPSQIGALDASSVVDGGDYVGVVMDPEVPTINITQQPVNQTSSSGAATFTVAASVSDGSTPTFQWEKSDDAGTTWAAVSGATSASLDLTGLTYADDHSDQYRAVVSATGATSVTSSSATLTVPDGSSWVQRGGDIDGLSAVDNSGWSVAVSNDGTVLATGARYNNAGGPEAGCVRVYSWDGTAWAQRGADFAVGAAGDQSGYSVALNGDGTLVAVGAPLASSSNGLVRVYSWNGTAWAQRGSNITPSAHAGKAGFSLALDDDGEWLVVGSPYDSEFGSGSGEVKVFRWTGTEWDTTTPGAGVGSTTADDNVGYAVAISGDGTRWAWGGPGQDYGYQGTGMSGVRKWNGSYFEAYWLYGGTDSQSYIGYSVALNLDGTVFAVGGSGTARVFANSGNGWQQRGSIPTTGSGVRPLCLSDSGTVLAVGNPDDDGGGSNAGNVRVYAWNGSAWVQRGPDIDGEAANDYSGHSVALSADGSILVVGAYGNDGGGTNSGHVRVYKWQ